MEMTEDNSNKKLFDQATKQNQFLKVVDRDEAERRFREHLKLDPLGAETVPLDESLGRVLATEIVAEVDVPGFDRSNMDGFAVRAEDTFGAIEEHPRIVRINPEVIEPGRQSEIAVTVGTATPIATGAMIPRGADAVVMIEDTERIAGSNDSPMLEIRRAVAPGDNISFAGSDIAWGETILRAGELLTSREIGLCAAVGLSEVAVFLKPQVAIISTGNEIVAPGQERPDGFIYDSNQAILATAVTEAGGIPIRSGIVADDETKLREIVKKSLVNCDTLILSGGTSKGAGDLSYRVVSEFDDPGIVAHGVALKPGKPICLAVTQNKPLVVLPGFPTSAIFTFHEFVAPVIRSLAGKSVLKRDEKPARLPFQIASQKGRTEYLLVHLLKGEHGAVAYPMGKGSGSVSTFSKADGFITIGRHTELVPGGESVLVTLLGKEIELAEFVAIGSHCIGLDFLLSEMTRRGTRVKSIHVGSTGGLEAVKRGECHLAGVHLLDEKSGTYNKPFLTEGVMLLNGYRRMQGVVYRKNEFSFEEGMTPEEVVTQLAANNRLRMINRNAGSGTRILIDRLLKGFHPEGYSHQSRSHQAVGASIRQKRSDWGIAIGHVAEKYELEFFPVLEEHFDFMIPEKYRDNEAVLLFEKILGEKSVVENLCMMGFESHKVESK